VGLVEPIITSWSNRDGCRVSLLVGVRGTMYTGLGGPGDGGIGGKSSVLA